MGGCLSPGRRENAYDGIDFNYRGEAPERLVHQHHPAALSTSRTTFLLRPTNWPKRFPSLLIIQSIQVEVTRASYAIGFKMRFHRRMSRQAHRQRSLHQTVTRPA